MDELDIVMAAALGSRIKSMRLAGGLTQAAVARASGIRRVNISRLEGGKHMPDIRTVVRVANAMGLCPSDILGVLDEATG